VQLLVDDGLLVGHVAHQLALVMDQPRVAGASEHLPHVHPVPGATGGGAQPGFVPRLGDLGQGDARVDALAGVTDGVPFALHLLGRYRRARRPVRRLQGGPVRAREPEPSRTATHNSTLSHVAELALNAAGGVVTGALRVCHLDPGDELVVGVTEVAAGPVCRGELQLALPDDVEQAAQVLRAP
jgi:hypothetical protein